MNRPRINAAFAFAFAFAAAACSAESTKDQGKLDLPPDAPPRADTVDDPELPQPTPGSGTTLQPTTPANEATPEDPATKPATMPAAPASACDLTKPFGAPELLSAFSTTAYETGGRFSADELTFYFSRASSGNMQPMMAKRPAKDQAWGKSTVITAVDTSTYDDSYFMTTADGLTAFMISTRQGDLDVFRTTRTSTTATWTAPALINAVMTTSTEDDVWVVPNGSAIYFDSNRSGNWELYRAAIDESGAVKAPAVVAGGPTTVGDETNPVVTPDELTMYFSRASGSQQEIRVSHRASVTEQWGQSALVTELNSTSNDRVTWVSDDGCRVVVSSSRAGGAGSNDLYLATRPQ